MSRRILLIRMVELGDAVSITIPAIRHLQKQSLDAQVDVLTYGKSQELVSLATPDCRMITLDNDHWPDNLLPAMEAFLGLAEKIIGQEYHRIINLDTAFMPCFLARFLSDAGEKVEGNLLGISVQQLIDQVQSQQLQIAYVNDPSQYMQSTYFGMLKWHSPWWQGSVLPENGYGEFYLRACCGWTDIDYDNHLPVSVASHSRTTNKVISLALSMPGYIYSEQAKLVKLLENAGFVVQLDRDTDPMKTRLSRLASSDLLVTLPQVTYALAQGVKCPTLLLCGQVDPRTLMPDYATEMGSEYPGANDLFESIESIFSEAEHE